MYNPRIVGSSSEYGTIELAAHEAIAVNDFVTIVADGQAEVTDAGDPIFGVALESASSAGDIITVAKVVPGMQFIMDNDNTGTTFASTHVGARFDITGTTGELLVDTSTDAQVGDGTDTGQLFCLEFNPAINGYKDDESIGIFQVAEIQGLNA